MNELNRRQNYGSVASEGSFFGGLRESSAIENKVRERTFVGTPLYVAPEMLEGSYAGKFTDLWALGCMIYQFHIGQTPFQDKTYDKVFQKISLGDYDVPKSMDKDASNLIKKLLDPTPEHRLGLKSYKDLKSHPYFKCIDFEMIRARKLPVPCQEVFGVKAKYLTTESEDTEAYSIIDARSAHNIPTEFLIKHKFDECCQGKIDVDQIVMEGWVRVRRKLFFYKRRQLFLMENGMVYIVKDGHISNEIKLSKHTEITHICENGNCKFLLSNSKTYEYIECENSDMASTWVNILLNIRKMTIEAA